MNSKESRIRWLAVACVVLFCGLMFSNCSAVDKKPPFKVLIVDGQNNHNWAATTPVLKEILEDARIFTVEVATTPAAGKDMGGFRPEFKKYDVIVMNYTGDDWPQQTKDDFQKYISEGGGMVAVHAANNAFAGWKEYNEMCAVGGWSGRDEKSGPMVYWLNGKIVYDTNSGPGGSHGPQHAFQVVCREPNHPIMKGLPEGWMHVSDELYSQLRGPCKRLEVLATAYADPQKGGTGKNEPILMAIGFGKGRIFHTVLGHAPEQMRCVGFIYTLQRGSEWAATGKVKFTVKVPSDFPKADKVSSRKAKPKEAAKPVENKKDEAGKK